MQLSRISALTLLAALAAASAAGPTRAAAEAQNETTQPEARPDVSAQSLSGSFLAATFAQGEGDLDAADAYYDKALLLDPTSVELQRGAMRAFIASGRFDKGLELAAKLRDDDEDSKIAHIVMGVGALAASHWDTARSEFAAVETNGIDTRLMSHLRGWADVGDGKAGEAINKIDETDRLEAIERLKEIDGLKEGDRLASIDRLSRLEAIGQLKQISGGQAPDRLKEFDKLGRLEAIDRLKDAEKAGAADRLSKIDGISRVEAFKRLKTVAGVPWFPIFNRYQVGLMASFAGDTARARGAFNELLDDEGSVQTSPDAYLAAAEALARLEVRAGDKDAALAAIDRGLAVSPSYDVLVQLRADIEAGKTVAPAVESARDGAAEALYILGQAINSGDGRLAALLYFQCAKALATTPSPKLLLALAETARGSQNIALALSYYSQIPQSSAYHRFAELQSGMALWYADRKDEAKTQLKKMTVDYPKDLQARLTLADLLSAEKDYGGAAALLEQAVSLAPEGDTSNWNIYYQRGIAYERLKQWNKAEPDFKKALELSPNQPQVLNYLGYSWVDMNRNLDQGLAMIRTAVEARPNDAYIIDSLGWAYYRLGRFPDAVEQLELAVNEKPSDPTINDHLGDAYWQVGRRREAQFQWNRALASDPKPEEADVRRILMKIKDGLTPATESSKPTDAEERASASETPAAPSGATAN